MNSVIQKIKTHSNGLEFIGLQVHAIDNIICRCCLFCFSSRVIWGIVSFSAAKLSVFVFFDEHEKPSINSKSLVFFFSNQRDGPSYPIGPCSGDGLSLASPAPGPFWGTRNSGVSLSLAYLWWPQFQLLAEPGLIWSAPLWTEIWAISYLIRYYFVLQEMRWLGRECYLGQWGGGGHQRVPFGRIEHFWLFEIPTGRCWNLSEFMMGYYNGFLIHSVYFHEF